MNQKFKIALIRQLKFALRRRSGKEGFAIPIALGLGLVMILVGVMMIVRSQGDKVNAIQKNDTDLSLAVAESGVSQILVFIGQNSEIAPYQSSEWTNASTVYSNIPCGKNSSGVASQATTYTNWVNLNGNPQNQFKLVKYDYSRTDHATPGTGTLEIEARTGVTATNPSGTSRQDLKVTIQVSQANLNSLPVPGLWVSSNSASGTDNMANIVGGCGANISGLSIASPPNNINPTTGQPWTTVTTVIAQPSLPPMPAVDNTLTATQIPSPYQIPTSQDLTLGTASGTYPRFGDRANSNGVYEYLAKTMGSVTIGNLQKVTFYMVIDPTMTNGTAPSLPRNGDVASTDPNNLNVYNYIIDTFSAGLTLASSKKANIYLKGDGGTVFHDCNPSTVYTCSMDLIVYGYGTESNPNYVSNPPAFALNGNSCEHNLFLFAPKYYLSYTGGGNCGQANAGDLIGLAWVANWTGTGSGNHTGVRQDTTVTWNILTNVAHIQLNAPPQISSTTSWQQQAYH